MGKKVYGFEIWDNDSNEIGDFMLYTIRDNFLKPGLEKFELGWKDLFSLENLIGCLKHNNIDKLFTYQPNLCETVCSAPYELNTEYEFEMCESDGKWNRFGHHEISLSKKEKEVFNKNKIQLISLTEKEICELEKTLKFHY
jgi:hypothetical protein